MLPKIFTPVGAFVVGLIPCWAGWLLKMPPVGAWVGLLAVKGLVVVVLGVVLPERRFAAGLLVVALLPNKFALPVFPVLPNILGF